MQARPRIELSDEVLGRCADLAEDDRLPMEDRTAIVQAALPLGLDALEALHAHEVDGAVCSVEGCTDAAAALLPGGYRCQDCLEFDTGGTL